MCLGLALRPSAVRCTAARAARPFELYRAACDGRTCLVREQQLQRPKRMHMRMAGYRGPKDHCAISRHRVRNPKALMLPSLSLPLPRRPGPGTVYAWNSYLTKPFLPCILALIRPKAQPFPAPSDTANENATRHYPGCPSCVVAHHAHLPPSHLTNHRPESPSYTPAK